jgi:hypothetical protein
MKETSFEKWSCVTCDYEMDTIGHLDDDEPPKEGDYSLCLNCGALYKLNESVWTPAIVEELDFEFREELDRVNKIRKQLITEDLSLKQKFRKKFEDDENIRITW